MTLRAELTLPRWAVKAWWRLHERDSGLAPDFDVYGSPASFPYGKVAGLEPDLRVVTETGETPFVCCGYCAAHMACWTAREGLSTSMFSEAHAIRSDAGRSHNSGSNASELRNGAAGALGITLEAIAVDEIVGQLRAGFAVAASLQYADLPDYLRVQGGDFGHGVTLYGYRSSDEGVGYFDPLWPQGVQGAWARWRDLTPALWADGNHSTTVTRWPGAGGSGDMPINSADGLVTGLRADVPAGLDFFADPNLTEWLGSMSSAASVVYVGNPIGETVEGGSRAIQVNTGSAYNDGSTRPTIVYVAADAVDPYSVPPAVPPSTDADAIREARDAEWEHALRNGDAWPIGT